MPPTKSFVWPRRASLVSFARPLCPIQRRAAFLILASQFHADSKMGKLYNPVTRELGRASLARSSAHSYGSCRLWRQAKKNGPITSPGFCVGVGNSSARIGNQFVGSECSVDRPDRLLAVQTCTRRTFKCVSLGKWQYSGNRCENRNCFANC